MRKYSRRIKCVILAAVLCISLVFCGCQGSSLSFLNYKTEPETADTDEKIKLSVWAFFDENTPGTYYVDLWQELEDDFGYDIELKTYSTEQIKDKLKIALVCDELPDVFVVWGGNYPNFLFDANACVPVEQYLEKADYQFKDSYVQPYKDGHNYIIPCLEEAYAVTYCNQNLMKEIGLSMPQTWDELLEMVEKVNAYNEEHGTSYAALELGDKDLWLAELLYTVMVNCENPYAQARLADGTIDFSDPVFADAAQKLMQLVDMGAFPEKFLETGEVEAVQNFAEGQAVLFPHQSTIVFHLMDEMGSDAISVEQFPGYTQRSDDDGKYMVDINHTLTPGLSISSDSEYQDEAAELCLEFAKRVNERNVEQYDYLDMIQQSGLTVPEDSPLAVEQFHQMIDESSVYTPLWYAVMDKEDGDNWRNLIKKLLGKAITVDEFVQSAPQYMNFTN